MRKIIVSVVVVLIGIAAVPQNAQALGATNFYFRTGLMTGSGPDIPPLFWTVGGAFDFNLGPLFTVGPECDIVVYRFTLDPIWIAPAVMANIRIDNVYFGVGAAKFILIGSGDTLTDKAMLKLNAGIKSDTFKLQIYALSPFNHIFEDMIIGLTLGIGL